MAKIKHRKTMLQLKDQERLLLSCLSSSWGGLEMAVLEFAEELKEHRVSFACLCIHQSPLQKYLSLKGIPYYSMPQKRTWWSYVRILRGIVDEFEPSTILINLLPTLKVIVPALLFRKKVKLVAISHMLIDYNKKDFLHRWLYRRLNNLIVLTQIQKKNHQDFLPVEEGQLQVIPDWSPLSRQKEAPISNPYHEVFSSQMNSLPLAVVASRIDSQKGQDLAIKALALAKEKGRPFRLAILGDCTLNERSIKAELQKLALQLGVTDYVRFLGHQTNVYPYLKFSDFMLLPSKKETFGRVILEAMESKTLVIASRAGGVPEIIQDGKNGLLFESGMVEDLERKIADAAIDTKARMRMIEQAFVDVKMYDRDLIYKKIESILFNKAS